MCRVKYRFNIPLSIYEKGVFIVKKDKRNVTVCRKYKQTKGYFPIITLTGKWLQDNGFVSGSKIEITFENDLMVIKPISKPKEQL